MARHHRHESHRGRTGSRGRDPRIARTRSIVLEAARQLLEDEGPDAVTALRVSDVTGIARTTIYRHWPDREDLLRDVLDVEEPQQHVELTGNTRADLMAVLQHMVERMGKRRGARMMAVVIERSGQRGETGGHHREMARRRMDPLRKVLEAGVAAGTLQQSLDIEGAIAQLAGPLFFQAVFVRRRIAADFVATVVDSFLAAHSAS